MATIDRFGRKNTPVLADLLHLWSTADETDMNIDLESLRNLMQGGQLGDMNTADKSGIIAAINELLGRIDDPYTNAVFVEASFTQNAAYRNAAPKRGKYLGSSFTAEQSAAIRAGTFEGMWKGDYWTIGGVDYVIVHFDPKYKTGDTSLDTHHVGVMPRGIMTSAAWNIGSNDTSKGYVKSDIRVVTIQGLASGATPNVDSTAGIQGQIISAFGSSHVLKYRALYPTTYASNQATGWAWTDARVELLNEVEAYGSLVWAGDGKGNAYEVGADKSQLALLRDDPAFVNIRADWWLRSVISASDACLVYSLGPAGHYGASHSHGVRPLSLIA